MLVEVPFADWTGEYDARKNVRTIAEFCLEPLLVSLIHEFGVVIRRDSNGYYRSGRRAEGVGISGKEIETR